MTQVIFGFLMGTMLMGSADALACGGQPCDGTCASHASASEVVNPFALSDVTVLGATSDMGASLTIRSENPDSLKAIYAWSDQSVDGKHAAENVTVSVEKNETGAVVSYVGSDAESIAWAQKRVAHISGSETSKSTCPHAK